MKRKTLLIIFFLILATLLSFLYFWPDDKLHFIACDVGQGDAILLTHRFNQVLIDGGPNEKVLGCLARHIPFWDRTIEVVINTHPEKDHLRGLVPVIQRYNVNQLVINSIVAKSKLFEEFHQVIREKQIKIYSPQQRERVKLGKIEFKVLWPQERLGDLALWQQPLDQAKSKVLGVTAYQDKLNENSIVLIARFGNFEALLTGDITKDEEKKIVDFCSYEDCGKSVDILKVAHHGSKTSSSQEFLDFFQPKIALICVGENRWDHPVEEVIERIKEVGARNLRTDQMGEIEIKTDGRRIFW